MRQPVKRQPLVEMLFEFVRIGFQLCFCGGKYRSGVFAGHSKQIAGTYEHWDAELLLGVGEPGCD